MNPGAMARLLTMLLLVSLAGVPSVCSAGEGAGLKVAYLQGRAFELDGHSPDESIALDRGDTLGVPTTVRVDQGGRLGLMFPDGSVFRLAGPGMVRPVESVSVGPERVYVLEMSLGEGWLGLLPFAGSHDEVEIILPAVTLHCKQAQFRIRVAADRRCVLAVISGEVVLRKRLVEEADDNDVLVGADGLLEEGGQARAPGNGGPLTPDGANQKIFRAGELVRIGVGGSLSDVEAVDEAALRDDAWVLWNLAQDREAGIRIPGGGIPGAEETD